MRIGCFALGAEHPADFRSFNTKHAYLISGPASAHKTTNSEMYPMHDEILSIMEV